MLQSRGVSGGDAAFLVSVGGLCNTVGRLVGGAARWGSYCTQWIDNPALPPSDLQTVRPLHLTLVSLATCLLPSVVLPLCQHYWAFLLSFGAVGFLTGQKLSMYYIYTSITLFNRYNSVSWSLSQFRLFKKRHSQLSNLWHARTICLSLVDTQLSK